jgi:hypothetical protein
MKCEQKGWCYLFTPLPAKVTSEATGLEQGFTNSTAHVRHLGSQENAGSGWGLLSLPPNKPLGDAVPGE